MTAIGTFSLLALIFWNIWCSATPMSYEVRCQFYDLATAHILAEESYIPSKNVDSFLQFSFQEFQLKIADQALDKKYRKLQLKILVEHYPEFDVTEEFLYESKNLPTEDSFRLGHVGTEWPGVGNTIWLYCDALPSKAL